MEPKKIQFLSKYKEYLQLSLFEITGSIDEDNGLAKINIQCEKEHIDFRFHFQVNNREYREIKNKNNTHFYLTVPYDFNIEDIDIIKKSLDTLHSKIDFIQNCYIKAYEEVFYDD